MTTIKLIEKPRYTIALIQANSGLYYIKYSRQGYKDAVTSEGIRDLTNALFIFDVKITEFEGH